MPFLFSPSLYDMSISVCPRFPRPQLASFWVYILLCARSLDNECTIKSKVLEMERKGREKLRERVNKANPIR